MRKNVIILRLSAIGDTIMTVWVLSKLSRLGFEPTLLTSPQNFPIARSMVFLRRIGVVNDKDQNGIRWYCRAGAQEDFVEVSENKSGLFLSKERIEVWDFQNTLRSKRCLRLLKGAYSNVLVKTIQKDYLFRWWLLFKSFFCRKQYFKKADQDLLRGRIIKNQIKFMCDNISPDLSNMGLSEMDDQLKLPILSANHVGKKFQFPIENYIAIFPVTSGFIKSWPKEHLRKFIELVLDQTSLSIVLCGASDAKSVGEYLEYPKNNRIINNIAKLSLDQTLFVIQKATYVVSGDSFPAHACDAIGVPASIIFGPTTPQFGFAPLSSDIHIHYKSLSCSPCSRHGLGTCRYQNLLCQTAVKPEEVFEVLKRYLK